MTGVAPIDAVVPSVELSPSWRVLSIQLEFGPYGSVRELSRAFGESLARSGLIACSVELLPVAGGHILRAACLLAEDEPAVGEALAPLLEGGDGAPSPPSRPGRRPHRCSLAP